MNELPTAFGRSRSIPEEGAGGKEMSKILDPLYLVSVTFWMVLGFSGS